MTEVSESLQLQWKNKIHDYHGPCLCALRVTQPRPNSSSQKMLRNQDTVMAWVCIQARTALASRENCSILAGGRCGICDPTEDGASSTNLRGAGVGQQWFVLPAFSDIQT